MARIYEGKVIINLQDLWKWINEKYMNNTSDYVSYGIPKLNAKEDTIELDFAASSVGPIEEWPRKPEALKQWERVLAPHKKE